MTKDEVLKLSRYGLICCEELDTMRPSEMNRLKWAVTTTVTDDERKANKSMLAYDAKPELEASMVTMDEIRDTFDTLF